MLASAHGADRVIEVPVGPPNVASYNPFQPWQWQPPAMRYQQVYDASAFAGLEPTNRYITQLEFPPYNPSDYPFGYSTNLKVYLSTTAKTSTTLSTNFAANVGPDELLTVVTNHLLPVNDMNRLVLTLPKPFVYNPTNGNLLLEVRTESTTYNLGNAAMAAHNSATDAVSCVFETSVTATQATAAFTIGLKTFFHFNPVPSLRIYTSYFGTPTNWFSIEWATQPTVFVLQKRTSLATNSPWVTVTNNTGGPNASFQRFYFPVQSSGASAYYRLAWEQ